MRAMARFGLLRAKGFLALAHQPMRMALQATPRSTVSTPERLWREGEARATRLVFIGLKGLDTAAIKSAILGDAS